MRYHSFKSFLLTASGKATGVINVPTWHFIKIITKMSFHFSQSSGDIPKSYFFFSSPFQHLSLICLVPGTKLFRVSDCNPMFRLWRQYEDFSFGLFSDFPFYPHLALSKFFDLFFWASFRNWTNEPLILKVSQIH